MIAIEEIKLNLGGRGTRIPGFKTVDLSDEHDVDVQCNVANLVNFADNSVTEIYASQILEHFPHAETKNVLKEWHRVLIPGGKIFIGVPDFARGVELFLSHGLTEYVANLLFGDQGYPLAFHYAPFTFARLAALMHGVGFRGMKRLADMPYGLADCSALRCNADGKSVSLNIEATK